MAAGRYEVSRSRDFHYFEKESSLYKNGYRKLESSQSHDYYQSTSNTRNSGGGSQRNGFLDRNADRELKDLSSCKKGSTGAHDPELWVGNEEMAEFDYGAQIPPGKKRKFSPILWDRDDKEVRISSKNRIVTASTSLCSPPSVHKSIGKVPNIISNRGPKRYPVAVDRIQGLQIGPSLDTTSLGSVLESRSDLPRSLPRECKRNDQEVEGREEKDYIEARNISTSKWANEFNFSDDEDMSTREELLDLTSWKTGSVTDISSPESGEFQREGSEGGRKQSSGSDKTGRSLGPASGDEYSENELDNNDHMEIDEKYDEVAGVGKDEDNCPEHRSINMLQGCRSAFEYEKLNEINEGTYGVVFRGKEKTTGEIVALKKVKMGREGDGFPVSFLREINILRSLHHPSVVGVREVVMDDFNGVYMVMEYMEHDLKGLMEVMKQPFSQSEVKCLMLQLLEGVVYLHENWVIHRDLKTSNLLLNNRGELKICDFGLSRQYGSPLKPYTPLVVTLWYRAPELLLGTKQYSTAIDMWSVGCIMAELLAKEPLFKGGTELEQICKICETIGTPNESIWPGFSNLPGIKVKFVKQPCNLLRKKFPAAAFTGSPVLTELGFDLLNKLLTYDPEKRITAEAALNHGWFREVPLPKSRDFMPTFPAQHVKSRKPIIRGG